MEVDRYISSVIEAKTLRILAGWGDGIDGREGKTYLPSHPPRAQTFPESWIATDAFPGCFVRAIVQDVLASVGAFCSLWSLSVLESICLVTCL